MKTTLKINDTATRRLKREAARQGRRSWLAVSDEGTMSENAMARSVKTVAVLVWLAGMQLAFGSEPETDYYPIHLRDYRYETNGSCEVRYEVPGDYAITGVAMRAADGRISTLKVWYRAINSDGTLGETCMVARGAEPKHMTEAYVSLPDGYVAVGFGIRIDLVWDVGVLALWGAKFHRDGTLGDPIEIRGGFHPTEQTEQQVLLRGDRLLTGLGIGTRNNDAVEIMAQSATASRYPTAEEQLEPGQMYLSDWRLEPYGFVELAWFAPPGRVITGVSMRAAEASVSTLIVRTHELLADGSLGSPRSTLTGWLSSYEPEGHQAMLPEGYVATGIALNIMPVADVKKITLWGARLEPDGTLGETCEVHGGFRPNSEDDYQEEIQLPEGRVLTGLGFRINNDTVLDMLAASARVECAR
jgi:ribosomal protein S16